MSLNERTGNWEGQAVLSSNLGDTALKEEHLIEAQSWYERGLTLARKIGRQDVIASTQYGLAQVLEKEGRYKEALGPAEEALGIYERLRDQDLEEARQLVERLRKKAG